VKFENGPAPYCSALLIGPGQLVTAAHCTPGTGAYRIKVWQLTSDGSIKCVNSANALNNAVCTVEGTGGMAHSTLALVTRYPGYANSEAGLAGDIAVVQVPEGWGAPANQSSS
jgi:hypothetical protein